MHIFWDIIFNLVALFLIPIQPALAAFSTILTNHDDYTVLKNFTTYTYSECYLICRRTTECDDVQVLDDKKGKNERRRCLILKKRNITSGCDNSYNDTSSKKSNMSGSKDRTKWKIRKLVGDEEKAIVRGASIYTLDKLTKEYMLFFDMKLTSFPKKNSNIIHLTTGEDKGRYGRRTPAVFFLYGRFSVRSAVNNQWEFGYDYTSDKARKAEFQLHKWYHIQIKQVEDSKDSAKIRYSVLLDGKVLQTTINSKPYAFENVIVYLSNPWIEKQPGYVRNLHIYTLSSSEEKDDPR